VRALVTGAAGFIGRVVCARLSTAGDEAVAFPYGRLRGASGGQMAAVNEEVGGEPVLVVTIVNGRIGAMQFPIGPASG